MNKESTILLHAAASGGPLLPLAGRLAETHRVVRIALLPDARLPVMQLNSLLAQGAATHLVAHGHAAPADLIATFMSRYGGSHSPVCPSLPAARSLAA